MWLLSMTFLLTPRCSFSLLKHKCCRILLTERPLILGNAGLTTTVVRTFPTAHRLFVWPIAPNKNHSFFQGRAQCMQKCKAERRQKHHIMLTSLFNAMTHFRGLQETHHRLQNLFLCGLTGLEEAKRFRTPCSRFFINMMSPSPSSRGGLGETTKGEKKGDAVQRSRSGESECSQPVPNANHR